MARRGSISAKVMVVVVVVVGALTGAQSNDEATPKSFWPPTKDAKINRQNIFRTSPEQASRKLYELLVGSKDTRVGLESIVGLYLPSLNPVVVKNPHCIHDVFAILRILTSPALTEESLKNGKYWPWKFPDSWGKVPDGILYGNVMPWGMQEECTKINATDVYSSTGPFPPLNVDFRGRYCLVSVSKSKPEESKSGISVLDQTLMRPDLQMGLAMAGKEVPPLFTYGTCIPSSCTPEDLRASIDHILNPVGKKANYIDCHVEDETKHLNAGDIVFVVILSVLGVIVLSAATVDLCINYFEKHELRQGPLKFLLVFSAYTNMKNIFAIKVKEHPDVITCLHGFRVFTMAWVVWGHGYMMQASVTNNLVHFKELSAGFLNQIIVNGTFSVDTFLFMSGLLLSYGILMEKEKSGRINWIMYYIHRFIRLSIPIMFTAAAVATVARFALVGPYADQIERSSVQACRSHWWADAFFFGNFYNGSICLPQCWYTAVDFQLFAVAPLVLAPLLLTKNKPGLVWLALVTVASVAVPMVNIAVYDLPPPGVIFARTDLHAKASVDLYRKPWSRANTYLVGIWAGWLLMQIRGKNLKIHPVAVVVGWLVSAGIALGVLFGLTDYNVLTSDPKYMTEAASIMYGGLSRLAWGVSLMWVVFACHTGYGGIVNSILSHPSLQPVSRLTYSLYLVTIPVQIIYMGAIYIPLYVDHLNKIIETCGYLFIGGIISVLLSVAVERPIMGLERILLSRPGRGLVEQKLQDKKES